MIMMNQKEKFYENLVISDEDRINAEKSLKSKRIEKHILIKEKLLTWNKNESIEYSKIASTYRYDKRIRYTLFKYISYLEEFYRGIILDSFKSDTVQNFWNKTLEKRLKQKGDLNYALERIEFSTLLDQCKNLPDEIKKKCLLLSLKHLNTNMSALIALRNAVMHNKFLLLHREYTKCYVNGVDNSRSANLKANILNLIQFLPYEVGENCAKDINACKEDRNKEGETKLDLPLQVVITI